MSAEGESMVALLAVRHQLRTPGHLLVLVVVALPRAARFLVTLLNEWCDTVAKTMAIDCRSCPSIARSRRSLRRRAVPTPAACSTSVMMPTTVVPVRSNAKERLLVVGVGEWGEGKGGGGRE